MSRTAPVHFLFVECSLDSMVVRRTSTRRRRVLNEEIVRTDEVEINDQTRGLRRANLLAYSSRANRRNQLKTTDLLPKRWLSFTTVVAGLLLCVGLLNLLAFYAPRIGPYIGDHGVEAFSLSGRSTLANWFTSFLLIASSMTSLQIYALRKHRRDDYQGSYRLWGWLAVFFLIVSIDCAVDIRSVLMSVFEALTHRTLQDSWLLIAMPLAVLAVISIRCLFEVRASRAAMAVLSLVWLTYSVSVLAETTVARQQLAQFDWPLIVGNCVLLATTGLLIFHLVYARFVYLHAHGLIELAVPVQKEVKTKAKRRVKTIQSANSNPSSATSKLEMTSATEEKGSANQPGGKTTTKKSNKKTAGKKASQPTVKVAATTKGTANSKSTKPKIKPARKKKQTTTANSFEELSDLLETSNDEDANILSMSKSEIRRQRKLQKQRRKAA